MCAFFTPKPSPMSKKQHDTAASAQQSTTEEESVVTDDNHENAAAAAAGADNGGMSSSSTASFQQAIGFGRNYFNALGGTQQRPCVHRGRELAAWGWPRPPWIRSSDADETPYDVRQVVCSTQATLFLTQHGRVYQTGTMHGHVLPKPTRINIPLPLPCEQVSAGRHFCLAKMQDGLAVVCWGTGHFGQLGLGAQPASVAGSSNRDGSSNNDEDEEEEPTQITFTMQPMVMERLLPHVIGSPIRSVAAGDWHGLALTQAGQVWAWGSNRSLQCGRKPKQHGSASQTTAPTLLVPLPVPLDVKIQQISAGRSHSVALADVPPNNAVYCWGSSLHGQCGNVVRRSGVAPPRKVEGLTEVQLSQVVAAGNHTLALTSGGRLFSWGANSEGQLGLGPACAAHPKPRLVADLDFVAIAAGQEWKQQQEVGAMAMPVNGYSSSSTDLSHVPRLCDIAASATGSAALSTAGHVYTWGSNDVGQLGMPMTPADMMPLNNSGAPKTSTLRDLHVKTFDSDHNVLLPTRVEAVQHLHVSQLAMGPNHMWCLGKTRPLYDSQPIGRTLYEVQEERRQKTLHRPRSSLSRSPPTSPLHPARPVTEPVLHLVDSDDYNESLWMNESSAVLRNVPTLSTTAPALRAAYTARRAESPPTTPAASELSSIVPPTPEESLATTPMTVATTSPRLLSNYSSSSSPPVPNADADTTSVLEDETETTYDPDCFTETPVTVTVSPTSTITTTTSAAAGAGAPQTSSTGRNTRPPRKGGSGGGARSNNTTTSTMSPTTTKRPNLIRRMSLQLKKRMGQRGGGGATSSDATRNKPRKDKRNSM